MIGPLRHTRFVERDRQLGEWWRPNSSVRAGEGGADRCFFYTRADVMLTGNYMTGSNYTSYIFFCRPVIQRPFAFFRFFFRMTRRRENLNCFVICFNFCIVCVVFIIVEAMDLMAAV